MPAKDGETPTTIDLNKMVCLVLLALGILAGARREKNFQKSSIILMLMTEIGTYTTMEDNNQILMRRILESPYDETTSLAGDLKALDKDNFNKMKLAYSSCMNEEAVKASGIAPLQKILADFEQQYPVAAPAGSPKIGNKEEVTNVLIWLAQHMFSELISVTILVSYMSIRAALDYLTFVTHQTNPTNRAEVGIYLSGEDDADLSKEDFKKSATINNYSKMMAEMMEVVRSGKPGSSAKPDAKALAAAKKIAEFQGKISKIVPNQEALNDLTVSPNNRAIFTALVILILHRVHSKSCLLPNSTTWSLQSQYQPFFRSKHPLATSLPRSMCTLQTTSSHWHQSSKPQIARHCTTTSNGVL